MVLKMSARETIGSLSQLQQRHISDSLGNLFLEWCLLAHNSASLQKYCSSVMLLQVAVVFSVS